MNIREAINKNPLVGWGVAAVALAAAAVFALTRGRDGDGPLTDKVTILFTDTNEKIEMRRGELEMKLLERAGPVDAAKGIINPATNQPTGVILNEGDWKRTVEKLNAMKALAAAQSKAGGNGNTAAPKPR